MSDLTPIDIDQMPDPLALPPGKYIATRKVVVRGEVDRASAVLNPGDTYTIPPYEVTNA